MVARQSIPDSSELYNLLLAALSVASPPDADGLTMKTIRAAISLPQIFDLQELVSLPPVQQFQKDNTTAHEFLQLFLTGDFEAYRTFTKSHPTWLVDNRITSYNSMLIKTSTNLKPSVKSVF